MKAEEIEKKQCNRFIVLLELYKQPAGTTNNALALSFERGVKNGFFKEAYNYLKDEGFIKGEVPKCQITHSGIKAVEYATLHPDERTEHFPPYNEIGI